MDSVIGNPVLSYGLAAGTALLCLFGLGMFLGKISEKSLIGYGIKTLLAGLVAILINFLLGAE